MHTHINRLLHYLKHKWKAKKKPLCNYFLLSRSNSSSWDELGEPRADARFSQSSKSGWLGGVPASVSLSVKENSLSSLASGVLITEARRSASSRARRISCQSGPSRVLAAPGAGGSSDDEESVSSMYRCWVASTAIIWESWELQCTRTLRTREHEQQRQTASLVPAAA